MKAGVSEDSIALVPEFEDLLKKSLKELAQPPEIFYEDKHATKAKIEREVGLINPFASDNTQWLNAFMNLSVSPMDKAELSCASLQTEADQMLNPFAASPSSLPPQINGIANPISAELVKKKKVDFDPKTLEENQSTFSRLIAEDKLAEAQIFWQTQPLPFEVALESLVLVIQKQHLPLFNHFSRALIIKLNEYQMLLKTKGIKITAHTPLNDAALVDLTLEDKATIFLASSIFKQINFAFAEAAKIPNILLLETLIKIFSIFLQKKFIQMAILNAIEANLSQHMLFICRQFFSDLTLDELLLFLKHAFFEKAFACKSMLVDLCVKKLQGISVGGRAFPVNVPETVEGYLQMEELEHIQPLEEAIFLKAKNLPLLRAMIACFKEGQYHAVMASFPDNQPLSAEQTADLLLFIITHRFDNLLDPFLEDAKSQLSVSGLLQALRICCDNHHFVAANLLLKYLLLIPSAVDQNWDEKCEALGYAFLSAASTQNITYLSFFIRAAHLIPTIYLDIAVQLCAGTPKTEEFLREKFLRKTISETEFVLLTPSSPFTPHFNKQNLSASTKKSSPQVERKAGCRLS